MLLCKSAVTSITSQQERVKLCVGMKYRGRFPNTYFLTSHYWFSVPRTRHQ